MNAMLLETKHIIKEYPGVTALRDVSIQFNRGEIHAIVGENGAGKSTFIKILAGSIEPSAGELIFEGKSYPKMNARQAIDLGISTIYQEFCLVNQLSVAENIFLGQKLKSKTIFRRKDIEDAAKKLIEQFDMDLAPGDIVSKLSTARQQMVEILRALSRKVKLLIMDEPSATLSNAEIENMFRVMRTLKERGITIIYISHRMEEIFEISDRVSIMRDGCYIDTHNTAETAPDELIREMVGRKIENIYPLRNRAIGGVSLKINGLKRKGFEPVSFEAREGEILGFGGLVGSGRTELMRCIFGADHFESGSIELSGVRLDVKSPKDAIKGGVALIPEDRKLHGLVLGMTVSENIAVVILRAISKLTFINEKKRDALIRKYIDALSIKVSGPRQLVMNLSGGNQQKVVLAKMLATDSKILILDEPTRGIDVGVKLEIYEIMNELCRQGRTILMISSDMPELLGMSDRILIMRQGRIVSELTRDEFSQERVLQYSSGFVS